tara:strand:+ start:29839 stop:30546 length:708 start_codon:yes stop_codon:yes gene_type:complete
VTTVLRKSDNRRLRKTAESTIWETFDAASAQTLARSFANLIALDEIHIPPLGALPERAQGGEFFTYVHRGAISQKNAQQSRIALAGEFQSASVRDCHNETNASANDWAHIFRLRLRFATEREDCAGFEVTQKERFTAAERRNTRCIVATSNVSQRALPLRASASIYSSILEKGHHIVHALHPSRSAWLHVIVGRVLVNTYELYQGDGLGLRNTPAISITAKEDSEVLFVESHSAD